ncbi:MAG: chemotaxis response regulator protein-glutamate methylesterase [Armatimonadota bacterium]
MSSKLRVLNVDDSTYVRLVLSRMLGDADDLEVVGQAADGAEGIRLARKLKPDVITLDIEMPMVDGLEFLRRLMPENPIPVVMLSSLTQAGAEPTLEALSLGAVDFVGKPGSAGVPDLETVRRQLLKKVRAAAGASVTVSGAAATRRRKKPPPPRPPADTNCPCILVAASTGGPQTLDAIFTSLPGDIPACFAITQHIPASFSRVLAERLDRKCALDIHQAEDGDVLRRGTALVAPGDYHMIIGPRGIVHLSTDSEVWGVRPAADPMMSSAAKNLGQPLVGLVLTGMGRDGAEGCIAIKKAGGRVFAEDEKSCVIYGMPKVVRETGCCDRMLPLDEIPRHLVHVARELKAAHRRSA